MNKILKSNCWSEKRFQSEIGVTGEPGPNALMCNDIKENILEQFDIDETGEDERKAFDAVIFIASTYCGRVIAKDEDEEMSHHGICKIFKGASDTMVCMLAEIFDKDPHFLPLVTEAIGVFMMKKIEQQRQEGGEDGNI